MDLDINKDKADKDGDGKIGDNYAPLTVNPSTVVPNTWKSVLRVDTYLNFGVYLVLC